MNGVYFTSERSERVTIDAIHGNEGSTMYPTQKPIEYELLIHQFFYLNLEYMSVSMGEIKIFYHTSDNKFFLLTPKKALWVK